MNWFGIILCVIFLFPKIAGATGVERVWADAREIHLEIGSPGFRLIEFPPHGPPVVSNAMTVRSLAGGAVPAKLDIPRVASDRDRLYSSFAVVVQSNQSLVVVGTNRYVEQIDALSRFVQPFPNASSKKGLQVQMLDDAIKLGVKHAALNVDLTRLVDPAGGSNGFVRMVDGRPVVFHRSAIVALDRQVKTLTDAGVIVTFIVLTYASGNEAHDSVMLHPGYDRKAPNRLGAFNSETEAGVRCLRGCFEFLADRYSDPQVYGGRVANYILGNEVNSHWFWSNMGRVSMETFAESHLRAARLAATAIRTASSSARLYLSLEHHWSIRYPGGNAQQAFPGRAFLEYFNRRAREQGNFEWHLAFHPYPENLFEPRTWKDKSATTNENTPRITFRNLEMLGRFLEREDMRWAGQPRRVILSEQGFHTVDGPNGELWQAAAYAYAYYKVADQPWIDAFILHRHVDHGHEGGLRLGLWSRDETATSPAAPKNPKRIYEVFRQADTPDWEKAFAFALPVIGIRRWDEVSASH